MKAALLSLLLAGLLPASGREPHFRYERPVLPGAAGPNRLEPDVALVARAAPWTAASDIAFADLRLFDAAGREIPYLLVSPARREPEWRAGRLLPIAQTKTTSGFEVDLGAVGPIDRLRIRGLPTPFLKRFRLEGGGDRSRWTLLVDSGTLFDLPDEELYLREIDFPSGDFRYLRLTWNDASSARLPLPTEVAARLDRPLDAGAPARAAVAFERRPSEPGKSRFHLRLPGTRLPVVALELAVAGSPAGPLLRRATVTEGRLAEGGTAEIQPAALGQTTLRRAMRDGLTAADLRLPLTAPEGPDLELTVDDGDNPPLALTGVTAELAPLPWIYFETTDTTPLTARFGDPKAQVPRYDLEAVRETVARSHPAAARWGEVRDREAGEMVAAESPLPALGAPLDPAKLRYRRPVPPAPPGLTSLLLDAAVLSKSPGLHDVRLVDAAHRQVPYLLEKRDEPLSLALQAPARQPHPGDHPGDSPALSRYAVELPYPSLPQARLVFTTRARVFEREVRLVEPPETVTAATTRARRPGREPEEQTVAQTSWRHADPDTPAPPLTLEVPESPGTRFDLLIEEGDNAPLPLDPPHLLLPTLRLRFFYPAEALTLLYGQPDLPAPRYDLSLLAPRLLGEAAHEIALAPETGKATPEPDTDALGKKIFWGVLVGAVLVLLVLLGKLLPGGGATPSA